MLMTEESVYFRGKVSYTIHKAYFFSCVPIITTHSKSVLVGTQMFHNAMQNNVERLLTGGTN